MTGMPLDVLHNQLHLAYRAGRDRGYWRGVLVGVALASVVWVIVWMFAQAI